MQDKGSVTETGTLPSFNGPTPPVFKADGGTTVGLGASMIGTAGITTTTTAGVTTIGVSTLGAMANAAVASIATQTSISLINNGGDVAATFKELGSKEYIKSLATSVVTAGVIDKY